MPKGRTKKSSRKSKSQPAKKSSKKITQGNRSRWKKFAVASSAVAFISLLVYAWYLDGLIERRFDGEAWARPSRVYARPLELYSGLSVTPEQLVYELNLANYQQVDSVTQPGQYTLQSNELRVYCREF